MSEGEVEPTGKFREKLDKVKEVVKKNWKPFTVGVVLTTATIVVTKRVNLSRYSNMYSGGNNFIMHRPIFKKSPIYHVTNNFGAPYNRLTRAVKCVETGHDAISISQMAQDMDLHRSQINQHLNHPDMYPDVKGYHFKSLGYVLPNKGNWNLSPI